MVSARLLPLLLSRSLATSITSATSRPSPGSPMASERNKSPIGDVLDGYLPSGSDERTSLLEFSSGNASHALYLEKRFRSRGLDWKPTELTQGLVNAIERRVKKEGDAGNGIQTPMLVDLTQDLPSILSHGSFHLVLSVNMIHIAPWAAVQGLFKAAGCALVPSGVMLTYGPYGFNGTIEPESNVAFDTSLRSLGDWGIRQVSDLEAEAEDNGLWLEKVVDMPANNKVLVWRKN